MNALNWVAQAFQPKNTDCTYKPQGGSVPEEPMAYFTRYFSPTLFSDLATFTNMYVLQTDGNVLGTSAEEIKVFCGILMLMGILKFPRIRMYWQASTRIPAIAESMTAKRFFRIRAALHITDSNAPRDPASQDKFWKVRPVIEAIRSRCLQLEPLEHNSIDEQMIPFTGRVPAKQFVKGKPNPEGVKVFLRCSADGLARDLELYQGKGTGVSAQHAHLGLGGSVVMRLVEAMPKGKNLKCFMDNYFTSVPLILQLKEMGILASGTIRANRLLKCCLKSEKELKKEGRGSMDEKVSTKGDIAIVRWQDNGVVNMASTQIGIGNVGKVKRWSEATKQHIEIDCPEVIFKYNLYMGGVDKLDFLMSLYPLTARTRKWPVRAMSHFLSFALCNSWIEYLRDASAENLAQKSTLDMMAFQTDIANSLIACSRAPPKKRGRPSTEYPEPVAKKARPHLLPTVTIRYDGYNHWPEYVSTPNSQRCRREGCKAKCRIRCQKCHVFLCVSAQNNCFYLFHAK
ncbi:piggyBac transposable element-derived protein 3-like [Dermacentor albipictus]|uniref:piggyBac transposable element-derived protein 3-like n=1 Tax=Dermacentor albipictus TaxID=60249 RepID=UPI0038FC9E53